PTGTAEEHMHSFRSMGRSLVLFTALIATVAGLQAPPGIAAIQPNDTVVADLIRRTQALLDAIAPGDKALWERDLAEGSLYSDEEGRVPPKPDLFKELAPPPHGYVGSIKIGDVKSLVHGNVVVLSHRDREDLELFGQKLVTYYQMTNTWAQGKDGGWQLVSTQVMAVPNERKPGAIDP